MVTPNNPPPGYYGAEDLGDADEWLDMDSANAFAPNRFRGNTNAEEKALVRRLKNEAKARVRVISGGLLVHVNKRHLKAFLLIIGDLRADEFSEQGPDTYRIWWD